MAVLLVGRTHILAGRPLKFRILIASTQNNPQLGDSGRIVSTIGLVLQLVSFVSYTGILLLFGYRV